MAKDLPNLQRTSNAVMFVDRLWNVLFKHLATKDIDAMLKKIDAAERKVGHAFWLDTQDRNAQDTCENYVRSDTIRDWVNQWRATQNLPPLLASLS